MTYLRDRIDAGEFRPLIDRTYPLGDIAGPTDMSTPGRRLAPS
jgi:hypothetical protein